MLRCNFMANLPTITIADEVIINKIFLIRKQKIMLDRDLAEMYGVETKALNQAVKRNLNRFPADFMFQMTREELIDWKSQVVTSNSNKQKMGLRKLPNLFTEQGVAMLSSVLRSELAVGVNIQIIRAFTKFRKIALDQTVPTSAIEKIMKKLDNQDQNMEIIFQYFDELLNKDIQLPSVRQPIGYEISKL